MSRDMLRPSKGRLAHRAFMVASHRQTSFVVEVVKEELLVVVVWSDEEETMWCGVCGVELVNRRSEERRVGKECRN